MRPRYRPNSTVTQSRFSLGRLVAGLFKLSLLIGLVGVAVWLYFQSTVRTKLAGTIQQKLNEVVAGSDLNVSVGQAQFVEGRGIALNNLRVDHVKNASGHGPEGRQILRSARSEADPPLVEFYDVFVHLPVRITELVLGKHKPQRVDIRRARLNLIRQPNGKWELGDVIKAFKMEADGDPIPVSVRDSEIRIVDQTRTPALVHRLTDVKIDFETASSDQGELTKVTISCSGNQVGLFQVALLADFESSDFDIHFLTKDIQLSPALFALLPEAIAGHVTPVKTLTGALNMEGRAVGNLAQTMPQFLMTGHLKNFAIDDARLPAPLTRAGASFLVSNEEARITDASGRIGQGSFNINYQQAGLLERKSWSLDGMVEMLSFHNAIALSHMMPKGCNQFCNDFSPKGACDIQFRFGHDGQRSFRTANAQLKNTSFRFIKFPYYVDQCQGTIDVIDDRMVVDMKSLSTPVPMTLKGTIINPGVDATYQFDLAAPGEIPLDEKLFKALDAIPPMARIVRSFRPTGLVGGTATLIKRTPQGDIDKNFEIDLKRVAIRHTAFPYPIRNITGRISADNLDFEFRDLVGSNGNGSIQCFGQWNPRTGLISHYLCENVNLDSQLRIALSPQIQEIWNGFRPRGTVAKLGVAMTMAPGEKTVNVVIDSDLQNQQTGQSNVSIFPEWFPYEIKQMAGNVKIGDGKIKVSKLNGRHDRTWLSCEGNGRYSDESWAVTMSDLLATSLGVDEDLLTALPTSLAPPVRQMKYQGLLNVQGNITVAGMHQEPSSSDFEEQPFRNANYLLTDPTMAWDLNFSMNDAEMLVGLPLESVFGQVRLQGIYDGKRVECKGEVKLDSLNIYGAQITDVSGPLWLDNDVVNAGALVDAVGQSIISDAKESADSDLEKRSLTGKIYGGAVKFDASMLNDQRGQFYVQTTVADGDIEEAARDFAPGVEQIKGRGFVAMKIGGDYANPHSYKGDGTVQLRDAKIYELPAIFTLLKALNVGRTDRTAFDSSNVTFHVNGRDIDFERIELVGDAISLIGNGRMNLEQDIDLNFYSIVGRNRVRVPILNELYHAGSQQILWISVDGTVSNPVMRRQVLPQLNDSLRQLFQPQNRSIDLLNRIERSAGVLQPLGGTSDDRPIFR